VNELEPLVLFGLQHTRSAVDARLRDNRLGTYEQRCDHDLIADDEAVDNQVVPIDLPAPRFVLRWLTEQTDELDPLAARGGAAPLHADAPGDPPAAARGA